MSDWFINESASADFGDVRLNKRMGNLLQRLGDKPDLNIPAACGGLAETLAAYRFFDNDKVEFEKVLSPHLESSLERIKTNPVVLLPQDTTEIVYTREIPKGLGTLKDVEKQSIHLHPTIAITPQRVCLGIVDAKIWERTESSSNEDRREISIEEKESFRWLEGYQKVCDIQALAPETMVVSISDRESDIYEFFLESESFSPTNRAHWIIRSAQNRRLIHENPDEAKIWEKLKKAPILGSVEFIIPKNLKREARQVKQVIRSAKVQLRPPDRKGYKLDSISVNVVFAQEENPPPGEKAIEWMLLTSLPIDTFEQVSTIIKWYTCRWEIEVYFRTLKSGCKIEKLQLETNERLFSCLAIYMIVAWRILFVTMLVRQCPDCPCDVIFTFEEWQSVYRVVEKKIPPTTPPSLQDFVLMLASLGGYLGRKNDGPPGAKTVWIGLQRMKDFVLATQAYQDTNTV